MSQAQKTAWALIAFYTVLTPFVIAWDLACGLPEYAVAEVLLLLVMWCIPFAARKRK